MPDVVYTRLPGAGGRPPPDDPPSRQRHLLGGILELGETPEADKAREVLAETGIHVEVHEVTGGYENLPRDIVALSPRQAVRRHGASSRASPRPSVAHTGRGQRAHVGCLRGRAARCLGLHGPHLRSKDG
ncbi:NUDIX domain-containing protein [Streptomyces bauhiniae]|uniref:NUDIX domain-containing protein n=1 Tax=Streptomyces bauhiniae TaxID=2340725 RepID=UPI0035D5B6C0